MMLNLRKKAQILDQYGNPIFSLQNIEQTIEEEEEWPILPQQNKDVNRFWEWLSNIAEVWPTRAMKITIQKRSLLSLRMQKTAEVYTAELLWNMMKGVENMVERESMNYTASGVEAVVNYPKPNGEPQRYHITIEPLDIYMRDIVWGEEGPPSGITNLPFANRLSLKKHAIDTPKWLEVIKQRSTSPEQVHQILSQALAQNAFGASIGARVVAQRQDTLPETLQLIWDYEKQRGGTSGTVEFLLRNPNISSKLVQDIQEYQLQQSMVPQESPEDRAAREEQSRKIREENEQKLRERYKLDAPERLPLPGEEFDLPSNLPEGIANRLSLKKRADNGLTPEELAHYPQVFKLLRQTKKAETQYIIQLVFESDMQDYYRREYENQKYMAEQAMAANQEDPFAKNLDPNSGTMHWSQYPVEDIPLVSDAPKVDDIIETLQRKNVFISHIAPTTEYNEIRLIIAASTNPGQIREQYQTIESTLQELGVIEYDLRVYNYAGKGRGVEGTGWEDVTDKIMSGQYDEMELPLNMPEGIANRLSLRKVAMHLLSPQKTGKLNLRKRAQIDQTTFFDFYGLSLLPEEYVQQYPEIRQYRDALLHYIKNQYIDFFSKFYGYNTDQFEKKLRNEPKTLENWLQQHPARNVADPYLIMKELVATKDPTRVIQLIDLLHDAEHHTGSYFVYAPEMKNWINEALALKAGQTPQQLLPRMSDTAKDIVSEYLRFSGESGFGQETDRLKMLDNLTTTQYEVLAAAEKLSSDDHAYLARTTNNDDLLTDMILNDNVSTDTRVIAAQRITDEFQLSRNLLDKYAWERLPQEVQAALLSNEVVISNLAQWQVDPDLEIEQLRPTHTKIDVANRLRLKKKAQEYPSRYLVLEWLANPETTDKLLSQLYEIAPVNNEGGPGHPASKKWKTLYNPQGNLYIEFILNGPEEAMDKFKNQILPLFKQYEQPFRTSPYIHPGEGNSGTRFFYKDGNWIQEGVESGTTQEEFEVSDEGLTSQYMEKGKERLPEPGEKFDLPKNLPSGIASKLSLKKKTTLNLKKKALDIGGITFPDITKETVDAFVSAQSYVADRLWYWLNERHDLPIFSADDYYTYATGPDQVAFDMTKKEMLEMFREAFNEWLQIEAPPEIKMDERQQQFLYDATLKALAEGYV